MITLDLNSLSFVNATELLRQEGYVAGECIEKEHHSYDRVFLYPYFLYDADGSTTDTLYFIEYCVEVEDDEYSDGRMAWDVQASEWKR